jgi:hypothetical protein
MISRLKQFTLIASALTLTASCEGRSGLRSISGTVTIDQQPIESGTLHFKPVNGESGATGGGLISNGKFILQTREPLAPGAYTVAVQAYRTTGRQINDPQRGKIAETASVEVVDSPKTVEVSRENSEQLSIDFSSQR